MYPAIKRIWKIRPATIGQLPCPMLSQIIYGIDLLSLMAQRMLIMRIIPPRWMVALAAPVMTPIDNSYALMVHEPAFTVPAWANDAVIYQIFPDRFRDGRSNNNPKTGDIRYDDPVLKLPWGTLPEGYCRNYADGDTNCPWRFDTTPPDWSPTKEAPHGPRLHGR